MKIRNLFKKYQEGDDKKYLRYLFFVPLIFVILAPIIAGAFEGDPAFSPDGNKIVFSSDRSGNRDIWIVNVDGSNPRQITTDPKTEWDSAWSPDGTKIVFARDRYGDQTVFNIWVVNADGSGATQLTFGTSGWEVMPAWSPDGSKIAFDGLWVMNANGSGLTKIITDGGQPSWSPDGTKIAFVYGAVPPRHIGIVNSDGSNLNLLTTGSAQDWNPSISPDGQKIAFTSDRSGTWALWTMAIDGTNLTNIGPSTQFGQPRWSPDGSRIIHEGPSGHIWILNADGSNPTILNIAWQPTPLPTSVGYNPQWLIITLVSLTLIGGYILRRKMKRA